MDELELQDQQPEPQELPEFDLDEILSEFQDDADLSEDLGDLLGEIRVKRGEQVVASVPAVAGEDVPLPGMIASLLRIRDRFMLHRIDL